MDQEQFNATPRTNMRVDPSTGLGGANPLDAMFQGMASSGGMGGSGGEGTDFASRMAGMMTQGQMGQRLDHQFFNNNDDDDEEYGDDNWGDRTQGMGPNGPGGSSWASAAGRGRGGREEYDEEGVRRPDPIRQERMLGGRSNFDPQGNSALSRADAENVTWLFPPPRQLSFPGSFQEARTMAKDEKKWILVNIQSHLEFSSQMMNRDTFVDETIISLLRTSFVFWQRGHTSPDAQAYMRTHTVREEDLPHLAVIDSRTGAKIVTIKGFISPGDLAMTLLEFLEENSFDNPKAPKQRNIDASKDFDFQVARAEGRNDYMEGNDMALDHDDLKNDDMYEYESSKSIGSKTESSKVESSKEAQENIPTSSSSMNSLTQASSSSKQETDILKKIEKINYGVLTEEPEAGKTSLILHLFSFPPFFYFFYLFFVLLLPSFPSFVPFSSFSLISLTLFFFLFLSLFLSLSLFSFLLFPQLIPLIISSRR
jgi:hypothetical protein